jgi:hypothetical protein
MERRTFVLSMGLLLVGGCSSNLEMNLDAVRADKDVEDNLAVVLVGNSGSVAIDYLQFTQSPMMPPIKVRNKNVPPNGIVAIPIPVGTKSLSLASYARTDRPPGYMPTGSYYGLISVNTPAIDIDAKGLYYVATVFPGKSEPFAAAPDPTALEEFRRAHPRLAQLNPVNFSWPN